LKENDAPSSDRLRLSQYKDGTNLAQRASIHERFGTNPQGWLAWVFDQLECTNEASILEVGCGPGLLWQHNAAKIANGWALYLSDFSSGMLTEARNRVTLPGRCSFLSSDAQALPFPDASFDLVIANHMLYHVADIQRVLSEIRRVMRPGAKLFAATNGKDHLVEIAELASVAKSERHSETAVAFQASIATFDLDTGPKALRALFPSVQIRRYEDSLSVTDAEAIVRYVQSSPILHLRERELARLRILLTDQIRARGVITVRKDAGLLIALKRNGA
jgi:SAM-dependent methyltransferase